MKEVKSDLPSKQNSTSIDGKQIIWSSATRPAVHMKSEPLKRREQLKQPPRLRQNPPMTDQANSACTMEINERRSSAGFNSIERREKKQVGIVKPLLTVDKENNLWNCSELERLQRRFSELIDGKATDEKAPLPDKSNLVERLESLYSSIGSHVYVSPSLVRLFVLTDFQVCSLEQWKLIHRGYPIWIYNTGLNPRRSAELRVVIVDELTGFILWSDRITAKSNLIQPTALTLSFRHSLNHSSIMLRFESADEKLFARFYSYLKQNQFYTEKILKTHVSKRLIRKSDISPSCHFKHLNHIDDSARDAHH